MATSCEFNSARGYALLHHDMLTSDRKYFASIVGLLLYMEGPHRKLNGLKIDDIYMLIKHA